MQWYHHDIADVLLHVFAQGFPYICDLKRYMLELEFETALDFRRGKWKRPTEYRLCCQFLLNLSRFLALATHSAISWSLFWRISWSSISEKGDDCPIQIVSTKNTHENLHNNKRWKICEFRSHLKWTYVVHMHKIQAPYSLRYQNQPLSLGYFTAVTRYDLLKDLGSYNEIVNRRTVCHSVQARWNTE